MEGLATSGIDLSGGFQLGSQILAQPGLGLHNAKTANGIDVVVLMLDADPPPDRAAAFKRALDSRGVGGLLFQSVDDQVAVAEGSAAGLVSQVPALNWRLKDRLKLFREIAVLVEKYHSFGQTVGPLDPECILLNNLFKPLLIGPGFVRAHSLYAPRDDPQDKLSARFSDIYSLGRLLHFLLIQRPPSPARRDPTKLADLMAYPAGLSRIIRKAIQPIPQERYLSVQDFLKDVDRYGRYEEVGIAHKDAEEINLGGLSFGPSAPMPDVELEGENVIEQIAAGNITEIQPFKLRQSTRSLLVVLGIVGVIVAFGINYLAGDPMWIRVALSVAAGLVGFALLSPGIEHESRTRAVFAALFACVTYVANPTPYVAKFAEQVGLESELATERVKSLKAQMKRGVAAFKSADLTDGDLKKKNFFMTNLEGASFENADLTGAKFFLAKLYGARFAGAKLYDAMFQETSVEHTIGFDRALCDGDTKLPAGWSCVESHPLHESDRASDEKGKKKTKRKKSKKREAAGAKTKKREAAVEAAEKGVAAPEKAEAKVAAPDTEATPKATKAEAAPESTQKDDKAPREQGDLEPSPQP